MPADLAAMDVDAALNALGVPRMLVNDNRAGGDHGQACYERQHERPEHREIVLLRMLGLTVREIAERTQYSEAGVNQILRQPWARERILENLHRSYANVHELLQREAAESLLTQIELRNDPATPRAVRNKICDSIIDRALGKPVQSLDITRRDGGKALETAEELQARLDKLRQEETALRGN